ncbi:MAG: hypothetical protein A2915_01325 [Candidatus Yanofskybacteria bacterium RIFCSPLOWO2_01_FULL_41_34]|uniref:Uncharacterized protein n=1 Tax=Candidatus Yanofskybacteria bacterium RIFCSPHIGHO2_01_FULL_41_26 TaxID=1802661 RepID=A0A1F8ED64_9BACT|nr:MAG: hypothetical protein A2649_01800 [Candidatus Yanofskybacteria bacterium RIFCSPHIGHO2_01_FULL_41_26]OGN21874.1 MAG: hypothetical protein A2915_01325 [Candidatus Yanofskybacteria bacterium RIFCSPLOWO2_01_FULL_41_34]
MESIQLLSEQAQNILGFEPVVMTGPKTRRGGYDNVFYDNNNRRLYIMRQQVGDETSKSYLQSDAENQKKKW